MKGWGRGSERGHKGRESGSEGCTRWRAIGCEGERRGGDEKRGRKEVEATRSDEKRGRKEVEATRGDEK